MRHILSRIQIDIVDRKAMKHTLSLTLDTLLDKKNGLRTVSVGFRLPLFLIKKHG